MSQVSADGNPVSANSPPPGNSCVQETSTSRSRHLSLGPRTYNVRDFSEFTTALDEFSRCMDLQTKAIKGWQHFADSLNVPPDIIHVCSRCVEFTSATITLFKHLEITNPQMTIGDLCTVLTRNPHRARHDLAKMLKDFSNECKVAEAITNSTSDIMDQFASELDSASPPTCTWMDVGLEIGIGRDILHQFEKDTTHNPTEELFRCLYTTGARNIKASVVVDYLTQMKRLDILEELKQISQSTEFDSKDAQDIFILGSEVLDRMSRRLNEDFPGVEGWKGLASRFLSNQYIDDRDIISKLETPHQHEIHSPTKKVIKWLTANKPEVTVNELIQKCREIARCDAAEILSNHYDVEFSCDDPGSPKFPSPVQETTTAKDNILKGSSKSFGLPCKPTTKMIGRADKQKELVDEIISGKHRLIVLHAATGYGKERLAVETAYQLIKIEHDYACIYVSSDDILTVEDLAIKILTTCGIPAPSFGEREKVQELFKVVKRKCLLILDNFDHSFHADDMRNDSMDSSTSTTEKPSTPGKSTTGPLMTYESGIVPFGKNHGCAACRESDPTYRNPKHFPWKNTTRKEELQKFIEDVLRFTSNLTILATTWEYLSATVLTKDIQLLPLTWSDSKELFLNMCESEVHGIERSSIPSGLLNSILECCSGIPQLLLNAVVIVKRYGFDHLASSTPEQQLKMLCKSRLSPNERFYRCLDICFDRLDSISQNVLMMISVFPAGFFTLDKAASIFKKEVKGGLIDLMNFSFLSYNQERKAYYLSPAMRSFAIYKATHEPPTSSGADSTDFDATYKAAITQFVCYTFNCTLKIENDFFSTCSADAIRKFREQEANLREIANWFMSDRFPKDPEMKNLKCYIIESFMECYLINIKVMERSLLKTILRTILRFCRDEEGIDSKKKETKKQYVECLTYGGVTCILGCLCVPQLCPIALDQAKWCFDEVLKALCSNAKTISSYKKQLKLVSNCKIMSKGAQTQFLLKYGKCLVRLGLKDEGLEFVEKGIEIREKVFKKSKFTKDRVMVAVGYNDLASAYSYNNDSNEKAIQIRITKVLPIYVEHLGCHPFTASALSHLGHDYLVLGSYEKALEACKKALSHRRRLLGEHSETARSLFDMGRILRELAQAGQTDPADKKSKLKEALSYLFEALKMHQDLAFTPKETAKNHVEIARVLKSLGQEEEAKEHEEKAGDWYMKVPTSTPVEIFVRGPKAIQAYEKALLDGKTKNRRLFVMLIGQSRAGKTSLLKSFRGLDFDHNEDSTECAVLHRCCCKLVDTVWMPDSDIEDKTSFEGVMSKQMAEAYQAEEKSHSDMETSREDSGRDKSFEGVMSKEMAETDQAEEKSYSDMETNKEASGRDKFLDKFLDENNRSDENHSSLQTNDYPGVIKEDKRDDTDTTELDGGAKLDGSSELDHGSTKLDGSTERSGPNGKLSDSLQNPVDGEDSSSLANRVETKDEVFKRVNNSLRNPKEAGSDDIICSVLDIGGQPVYDVTHPLFISTKGVFLLVHSLKNGAYNKAAPCAEKQNKRRELNDKCCMTNMDHLEFWLSFVELNSAGVFKDASKECELMPNKLPPVFLACTHADKPFHGEFAEEMSRDILKDLKREEHPPGKHLVRSLYVINNTVSGSSEDEGVKKLRKEICDVAKSLPHMNEDMPINWLAFEKELKFLLQKKTRYLSIEEAKEIALNCKVNVDVKSNQFITLLNYLHDIREIIYFEGSQTVFIDIQWLIDMIGKVITVELYENRKEKHDNSWKKLEEEGVLDWSLLKHVWSDELADDEATIDDLLVIMERFSLLYRWKIEGEQNVFLVPAMLLNSNAQNIADLLKDQITPIIVYFPSSHLPLGIFPRLQVMFAEFCNQNWPRSSQPKFNHNFCRFFKVGEEASFDLVLTSDVKTISVGVVVRKANNLKITMHFCQEILEFLRTKLEVDMRKNFPWMKNMDYQLCIRCPICQPSANCKQPHCPGCTSNACVHFISGEEVLQEEDLSCEKNPVCKNTDIQYEYYFHWFPKSGKPIPSKPVPKDISSRSGAFNMNEENKRWVVVGIAIMKDLLPILRSYIKPEISKHYNDLKAKHSIDTQITGKHLEKDGSFKFNYDSINNNHTKKKPKLYDCKVNSEADLAKLYCKSFMAKFTAIDESCDLSAVLGILSSASVFTPATQDAAKDVRQHVRNDWGHCNFHEWNDVKFQHCFQLMDDLIKTLNLADDEEKKMLEQLKDWKDKGVQLCLGSPVDTDLLKVVQNDVAWLIEELQYLKEGDSEEREELKRVTCALGEFRTEVFKILKEHETRITDVECRVKALEDEKT